MEHIIYLHPQQTVIGEKYFTALSEFKDYKLGDKVTFVERNLKICTNGTIVYVGNRPNNTVFKKEITVDLTK